MKTLLLLRHARPSLTSPTGRDFDRPLLDAGRAEARRVGHFLSREKIAPGAVVSSPALRARETAALVGETARLAAARFDERIYNASAEQLLEVISETEDQGAAVTTTALLIVGHNPGLAELITLLTGAAASVPPATLARIELDIEEWGEVRAAAGALGRLVFALPPGAAEEADRT